MKYLVAWKKENEIFGTCFDTIEVAKEFRRRAYVRDRNYCMARYRDNHDFSPEKNMTRFYIFNVEDRFPVKVYRNFKGINEQILFNGTKLDPDFEDFEKRIRQMMAQPNKYYFVAVHADYENTDSTHNYYDFGACFISLDVANKYALYVQSDKYPSEVDESRIMNWLFNVRIMESDDRFGRTACHSVEEANSFSIEEMPYEHYEDFDDGQEEQIMYVVKDTSINRVIGVFVDENNAEFKRQQFILNCGNEKNFIVEQVMGLRFKECEEAGNDYKPILNAQGVQLAEYFMTLDEDVKTAFVKTLKDKGVVLA